ncbi:MAG: DUF6504 family protein [Actinomycetota bacterium]|nr:DUF6504 family protein [Actinomycetota bacterium]
MTRRYRERIQVRVAPGATDEPVPRAFRWRGRPYRVLTVIGHWREDGGYWAGGGVRVPQRDLWRVEASRRSPAEPARPGGADHGVYELVSESGAWTLDRVWD